MYCQGAKHGRYMVFVKDAVGASEKFFYNSKEREAKALAMGQEECKTEHFSKLVQLSKMLLAD